MRLPLTLHSGTVDLCSLVYSFVGMVGGALWVAFIANELVGAMTIIGVEVRRVVASIDLITARSMTMTKHIPRASTALQ